MKSSDFITSASTKPKKVVRTTVVETQQRKRTSMMETLLDIESKYGSIREQRIAESVREEAEANRILRSMSDDDGDETPPVKHPKHGRHETHGAENRDENPYDKIDYNSPFKKERDLQPKADAKANAKPEVKGDGKKDAKKPKKPHLLSAEPFKQVAGKMGEDLYAVSDYEYNYTQMKSSVKADPEPLPSPRSDDEPVLLNRILRRVISNLGTETNRTAEFRDFLGQDHENFWHGGSIHAVILNDKTGQVFFFVADPGADFSTLVSGGFVSVAKRTPHGMTERNLTREQERILDRAKSIGDDYVKYARRTIETGYKHGYSEAVELRRQLLNTLGLGEGYAPPLDRDPQDIEAERDHKRRKAANDPKHTFEPTATV